MDTGITHLFRLLGKRPPEGRHHISEIQINEARIVGIISELKP
jgi:hypothetical protein